MQISSRFTIAVHILICIDVFGDTETETSESLSGSIGAHPVVIRRILGQLRRAGLIRVMRGREGGAYLMRSLSEITLADVFHAVESLGGDTLFSFHENPNPSCPVGRSIHDVLDNRLADIQRAMERAMEGMTLANIAEDARQEIKRTAQA